MPMPEAQPPAETNWEALPSYNVSSVQFTEDPTPKSLNTALQDLAPAHSTPVFPPTPTTTLCSQNLRSSAAPSPSL